MLRWFCTCARLVPLAGTSTGRPFEGVAQAQGVGGEGAWQAISLPTPFLGQGGSWSFLCGAGAVSGDLTRVSAGSWPRCSARYWVWSPGREGSCRDRGTLGTHPCPSEGHSTCCLLSREPSAIVGGPWTACLWAHPVFWGWLPSIVCVPGLPGSLQHVPCGSSCFSGVRGSLRVCGGRRPRSGPPRPPPVG